MVTIKISCRNLLHSFTPKPHVCAKTFRVDEASASHLYRVRFTRNWTRQVFFSKSKYRFCFLWHPSTKFDSWHTVSSRRATYLVESLQTTMSGLRSVLAMWGGNVKGGWSGRSAIMEKLGGRWTLSRLKMVRRTWSCLTLYQQSCDATGQLQSTWRRDYLSPQSLHSLGWPFQRARLELWGSVGVILLTLVKIVASNHCSNSDGNMICVWCRWMNVHSNRVGFMFLDVGIYYKWFYQVCTPTTTSVGTHIHWHFGTLVICVWDEGIQWKIILNL